MEKFTLTYETTMLEDGQVNIKVYPTIPEISKYICSYSTITTKQDLLSYVADLIVEMTPLLFADFQAMDNVPIELRNQFEL
jgi:hypothetical protein